MEKQTNGKRINNKVFWPPFILLIGAVAFSFINYDGFTAAMNSGFGWVTSNFGWLFAFSSLMFLVMCIVLAISPVGKIRFGGEDAKPEFSMWNWFAMSLCAGIAIGIVFWGAAEPIYHLASPPESLGIEPFSADAAMFSISTVFLHWTFTPYAMYVICAIPIGLAYYNYKQPFTVSSSLYFIVGDKCRGWIGTVVDGVCLFAIAGGVACSLGAGLMQLASGLNFAFGIEPTKFVWAVIAVVIIASYTVSSYTGINKGIRFLSDQNVKLFIFIMLFIFVTGPTKYILDIGVQGFGEFVYKFIPKSFFLGAVTGDQWPSWWSIFYWAAWFSYAPLVGMFLARIVRGRTIREFIAVNLVAPAVFGMVWFAIFGGAAINMQLEGKLDIWKSITEKGLESATFAFFQQFPLGFLLVPFFLIVIAISFITLADSMTTVVATLSTSGLSLEDSEPPAYLKIAWGVIMGTLAWVMISFNGINGVKILNVLTAFPIMFLMIAMSFAAVKGAFSPERSWFAEKTENKQNIKA